MIQKQTYLEVACNSGALKVQCIHVLGSTGTRYAYLGDMIKCAIKKAKPGGSVKKGEVFFGVIVRTRKEFRRKDGSYIRFGDNAVVIVNKEDALVGTRIFGPVARELRDKSRDKNDKYNAIISLAPEVL